MVDRNKEETQNRILKVAAEEFANMGFAGARVDTIAEKAGVNKALIYYYFKSKQNLLDTLFNRLLEKGIGLASHITTIDTEAGIDTVIGEKVFETLFSFLEENENMIRVIMIEGMKKGGEEILTKLLSLYYDSRVTRVVEEMKEKGVRIPEDNKQWMITELFTGLLPIINFILYRKNLSKTLDAESGELNRMFLKALAETHMHTHMPE